MFSIGDAAVSPKNQHRLVSVGIYPRPLHKAGCGKTPFFFVVVFFNVGRFLARKLEPRSLVDPIYTGSSSCLSLETRLCPSA